jgi:heme A synthase
VEFFLAGAGAFGATSFHSHRVVGVVLLAGAVIVLVVAAASRRNTRIALGLAVLVGAQVLLGHLGQTHPWIGAVHGLTAAAVAAVASVNVRMAMADRPRIP